MKGKNNYETVFAKFLVVGKMNMKTKRLKTIIVVSITSLSMLGCGSTNTDNSATLEPINQEKNSVDEESQLVQFSSDEDNPEVAKEPFNDNGYNFRISQDCLDAYLNYIANGSAEHGFQMTDTDEFYNPSAKFSYFSICGMADEDTPILLMTFSDHNETNGDLIEFAIYEPDDEGQTIGYYDSLMLPDTVKSSAFQSTISTSLYVLLDKNYAIAGVETKKYIPFLYCEIIGFRNDPSINKFDEYEYNDIYTRLTKGYVDGNPHNLYHGVETKYDTNTRDTEEETLGQKLLEEGKAAEIKWYSIDDIESARQYYSSFLY